MTKEDKSRVPMKRSRTEIVNSDVPSYIEPGRDGLENIRQQDAVLPRTVLLQPMSPPVLEKWSEKHVAGAVMNSLTSEIIIGPDEEVNFIPVFHFIQWIKWGDREENESILDSSIDPRGELAISAQRRQMRRLSGGKEVFDVTEYHNFVVVFPVIGESKMIVIPCCRTNHKKGRMLLGLASFRGTYPLYAGMYSLGTKLETNRRNQSYHVFEFKNAGWCPEELYNGITGLYTMLKEWRSIMYDLKGEQEEAVEEAVEDSEI
jgi:hypothetical protein